MPRKLTIALPTGSPSSGDAVIKDLRTGEVLFTITLREGASFTVRAMPRATSSGLLVRPDAGNSVTIYAKDLP